MGIDAERLTAGQDERGGNPVRELRDSLILLGFVVSSLGAYLALGAMAVRLLAGR